jgi:tetratricopeptide (TPR) repeat protein
LVSRRAAHELLCFEISARPVFAQRDQTPDRRHPCDVRQDLESHFSMWPAGYLMRGNANREKRDYTGAIADYTRVNEIKPKIADAYRSRSLVKHKKGDTRGATADLARAKQLAPAH